MLGMSDAPSESMNIVTSHQRNGKRTILSFVAQFHRVLSEEGYTSREWGYLLKEFRARTREAAVTDGSVRRAFTGVAREWRTVYRNERKEQALAAEGLNVFDVLGFSTDEVRHSRVLAWLLDRHSSHYQGEYFFSHFLTARGHPSRWARASYRVDVEQSGDESRIDIRIFAVGLFLIDIEVKVNAPPGHQQLLRESRDAISFARANGVPEVHVSCIYLSRGNGLPTSRGIFSAMSWKDISRMLEQSSKGRPMPTRLQLVVENYIDVLKSLAN